MIPRRKDFLRRQRTPPKKIYVSPTRNAQVQCISCGREQAVLERSDGSDVE